MTSILNSRIRQKRFLLLERKLTHDARGRPKLSLPTWLADLLFDDELDVQRHDGWSEFIVTTAPDDAESTGASLHRKSGRYSSGTQIRFSGGVSDKFPHEVGDTLILDIDLHNPADGILIRKAEEHERGKFTSDVTRTQVESMLIE